MPEGDRAALAKTQLHHYLKTIQLKNLHICTSVCPLARTFSVTAGIKIVRCRVSFLTLLDTGLAANLGGLLKSAFVFDMHASVG